MFLGRERLANLFILLGLHQILEVSGGVEELIHQLTSLTLDEHQATGNLAHHVKQSRQQSGTKQSYRWQADEKKESARQEHPPKEKGL